MTSAVRRGRHRLLARSPEPTDFYGVDLLVVGNSGRKPFVVRTLGATAIEEIYQIASECAARYPDVNRVDAFLISGVVEIRLIRGRYGWRRVKVAQGDP